MKAGKAKRGEHEGLTLDEWKAGSATTSGPRFRSRIPSQLHREVAIADTANKATKSQKLDLPIRGKVVIGV
jgi:hypothetical protein